MKMLLKLTFTLFLCLLFVFVSCNTSIENRIVGGKYCRIEENPFLVQVFARETKIFSKKEKQFLCGGSLLNSRWVLTAAHCVYSKSLWTKYTVQVQVEMNKLARNRMKTIDAEKLIPHPLYKDKRYDIALIYLKQPYTGKPYAATPPYAKLPPSQGFDRNCTKGKIMGWGEEREPTLTTTSPKPNAKPRTTFLKCGDVKITGKGGCSVKRYSLKSRLTFDGSFLYVLVDKDQVDSCVGDSGGPLLCNGVVIGIVKGGRGCGIVGACALYTRVEAYFHFIKKHTGLNLGFDSKPTDPIYENEYKASERKKVEEKKQSGGIKEVLNYKLLVWLLFVHILKNIL